jgi:hypothetical protein
VKGYFKSLSQKTAVPVCIVPGIDIPTQVEPSFISKRITFYLKNAVVAAHKNELNNVFFFHDHLLHLLKPV